MSTATLDAAGICAIHGEKEWVDCWNCEDGYSHHDCMDDCCVCADPEPNVRCDICKGKGGWLRCFSCYPDNDDQPAAHKGDKA